jgi:hypothetical protein
MVDDDAVAGPHIDVRPAAGRLDDFAEVVGVKNPAARSAQRTYAAGSPTACRCWGMRLMP